MNDDKILTDAGELLPEQPVKVKPPFIKLEQFLKFSGIAFTGGQAKIMILNNEISLNGEICTLRGKKIYEGDIISVEGHSSKYRCIF